jgi:hypothetical protein
MGEAGHLDLDIDPVEEGTGDAGEVAGDLAGGARAGVRHVAEMPAGAPVQVAGGVLCAAGRQPKAMACLRPSGKLKCCLLGLRQGVVGLITIDLTVSGELTVAVTDP